MKRSRWVALAGVVAVAAKLTAAGPEPDKLEFFEAKVRPTLVNHCYGCHSADTKPAG